MVKFPQSKFRTGGNSCRISESRRGKCGARRPASGRGRASDPRNPGRLSKTVTIRKQIQREIVTKKSRFANKFREKSQQKTPYRPSCQSRRRRLSAGKRGRGRRNSPRGATRTAPLRPTPAPAPAVRQTILNSIRNSINK